MLHSMERESPNPIAPAAQVDARRGDHALPIVLVVVLALVGALLVAYRPETAPTGPPTKPAANAAEAWTPSPPPEGATVSLAIDFGNGARRAWTVPWTPDMTVGDAMEAARELRPGIEFSQRGSGKTAFLTSLEGVANEGPGGRYWLYSIDGQHGQVSFAAATLQADAAVLWEFRRGE
jgi:hypothetical protein